MSNLPDEIPVDHQFGPYNPADDDDEAKTSLTLASTTHDFSYENGRRYSTYRSGSSNPFPVDELAIRNEIIYHNMLLCLLDNNLSLTQLNNPSNILDVRCAQGLWAENAAERWEQAEIVAMDTTPRERSTYPNCIFVVQSLVDEWVFDRPDTKFDFISARNCFATTNDFENLYTQCFEYLVPGGQLEQCEIEIQAYCDDGTGRPDSVIVKACHLTPVMSDAYGAQYNIAERMTRMITAAGFEDIVETKYKLPLGPWSADAKYKELGILFEQFYKSGLQGWMMAPLTRSLGYTVEQVNQICEDCFREIDERDQHFYFNMQVYPRRECVPDHLLQTQDCDQTGLTLKCDRNFVTARKPR